MLGYCTKFSKFFSDFRHFSYKLRKGLYSPVSAAAFHSWIFGLSPTNPIPRRAQRLNKDSPATRSNDQKKAEHLFSGRLGFLDLPHSPTMEYTHYKGKQNPLGRIHVVRVVVCKFHWIKRTCGIQIKNGKGLGFVNIRVPNILEMGEYGLGQDTWQLHEVFMTFLSSKYWTQLFFVKPGPFSGFDHSQELAPTNPLPSTCQWCFLLANMHCHCGHFWKPRTSRTRTYINKYICISICIYTVYISELSNFLH